MTNQNAVAVADQSKSSRAVINSAVAISNFFSVLPKPVLFPVSDDDDSNHRRVAASRRRKLLKQLDRQTNVYWVDSLRSSSPTGRVKCIQSDENHNHNRMVCHPSALEKFDQITKESKGKKIVIFLDYDGTLSPIVEDPDRAFMSDEMRCAVREVAKHFPTAIVTGRCMDKVYSFIKLSELYYAGSHGMDIKGPVKQTRVYNNKGNNESTICRPATEFLPMIEQVYNTLMEKTKCIPGAFVENNKFCASVHFRRVDEERWDELAEKVRQVVSDYPNLKLSQGRKVLEIRPTIKWDKGKAVEFLLESLGYAADSHDNDVLPIYIGDDRSDEDAFKVLRSRNKYQGLGILVSKVAKETNASYTLQDPDEVKTFLKQLVGWKRRILN